MFLLGMYMYILVQKDTLMSSSLLSVPLSLYCMCVSAGSSERGWPELPAGVLAPPGVSRRMANTEKTRLWSYSPGIYCREGGRGGGGEGGRGGGGEGGRGEAGEGEDIVMFLFPLFSKVRWVPQSLLCLPHSPHHHKIALIRFD